ncbi:NUDIX hydrolase, partial [Pseudomonas sp. SIMBA_067]
DAPLRLQPEEVIEARFVSLELAEEESLTKLYCPDSLAALQRYKASLG